MLMGQPRVFFSMARDGLLPPVFGKVHPKFKTPYSHDDPHRLTSPRSSAGFFPIGLLGELASIGTLLAFVHRLRRRVVLRVQRPELPRAFKTPLVPLVPIARHPHLRLP